MNAERFPLISVLIPNYNYARYVGTAVESVLAQTYPNFEVVVCDNRSTDGSWELLNERFGADPRVRLNLNERNLGMAGNFDRLLELARGEYVLWLSSDDFLMPTHLAQLESRFAQNPGLDVVYSGAFFADDAGVVFSMRALPGQFPVDYVDARDELVENLVTVCPVCWPSALFRRETLLADAMWSGRDYAQEAGDWEMIIRLALAGKRFAYVAQPSMAMRLHDGQATGDEYHNSGRNVLDFVAYVERYADHPEFVRRMRGREVGIVRLIDLLLLQSVDMNDGSTPFDAAQRARFAALQERLRARAAAYEPARVRDATFSFVIQNAGAPYPLLRALDSIAEQSYDKWEVVIVDHGPLPSEALLRSHRAWDRISYVRLPKQHVTAAALNLGIRMVRGEYVAFLDPDDRVAPDHLARAIEALARDGAQAAVAETRLLLERGNERTSATEPLGRIEPFGGAADLPALAVAPVVPLSAMVLYRGFFDQIGGFNERLAYFEDWEFAIRLARTGFAATGATTVEQSARLELSAQRLGAALPQVLPMLDAVYAMHPVDDATNALRRRYRAELSAAVAGARDWVAEPRGLAAFMCTLAGRSGVPAGA